LNIISNIHSQNWVGSFKIDSSCNTTYCCCLSGIADITCSSINLLKLESSISGQRSGFTTFICTTIYPSNYTGYITCGVQELIRTLSCDDNTITATDPFFILCGGKAFWSNAIKQYDSDKI
jgi:hypothetical protein